MAKPLDSRVADALRKYGEDPTDTNGVIWNCHGTWVVYHRAVERVAARAGITFQAPHIIRSERDEAVILVFGEMDGRIDWDIGEALVGVNYLVSGKQAAYVWAMATKRARDRLVLKLIGLHGLVYSEDEADDFKQDRPTSETEPAEKQADNPRDAAPPIYSPPPPADLDIPNFLRRPPGGLHHPSRRPPDDEEDPQLDQLAGLDEPLEERPEPTEWDVSRAHNKLEFMRAVRSWITQAPVSAAKLNERFKAEEGQRARFRLNEAEHKELLGLLIDRVADLEQWPNEKRIKAREKRGLPANQGWII